MKDFQDVNGELYLTGFYVLAVPNRRMKSAGALKNPALRSICSRPFLCGDRLPVNANGKLDRSALHKPDAGSCQAACATPTTPEQKELCEAFAEVLKVERVGLDDDFFAMGGDSIKAAEF